MARLHYIFDPLCGWCYGAAPLIAVARRILPIQLHAGGMMMGAQRQAITPALRAFVMQHDQHIHQRSGQSFGDAYTEGLLRDPQAVFDSEPPTAAILAAEELATRGLDMLAALQAAHFLAGQRINEHATLIAAARALGMEETRFNAALDSQQTTTLAAHIQATRALMRRTDSRGFPSLLLERTGELRRVELAPFFGNPPAFADHLAQIIKA